MTEPTRPRHRPELGYARGEQTRRRIVDAAIQLFGERGFEGASTRDIAKLAEVNAPALQYYFDGKEGLYRACAEHIAETLAAHFEPSVQFAEGVLARGDASREELIEAYLRLLDASAEHLLVWQDGVARRRFAAHEQLGTGPNMLMEILDHSIRPRLIRPAAALVARLTGEPEDAPLTLARVMTLHGQLTVFHMRPKMDLLRLADDAARLALIRDLVRSQTRAVIDSW